MKLGFIGCGNMATAILSRVVENKYVEPADVICYDVIPEALNRAVDAFGVTAASGNAQAAEASEILILAVKPMFYASVIENIRKAAENTCIVTLAPGLTLQWMAEQFQEPKLQVIRTMPNTPAMVGEGMTALCASEFVTDKQLAFVRGMFDCCGKSEMTPEYLMDAVVAVSGSSPAYIYILIEALADGAVAQGMPRQQAYTFAAQSVLGSAKMVLETKRHPGELKDMVCSPGGTTIAAVEALEQSGFRAAILNAMKAVKSAIGHK